MKIKNIDNPEEFLKVIDSCQERLNLSQMTGTDLTLNQSYVSLFHFQQFSLHQHRFLKWK